MSADLAASSWGWTFRCCAAAGAWLLLAGAASAQELDAAVEIRAQASLELAAQAGQPPPSQPVSGNATQQATLSAVIGGQRVTSSVGAQLRSAALPAQGGALRQPGDGVVIALSLSGLCDGMPARTDGLYGDYGIELRNRSASQAWRVTLKIDYANHVAAAGPASTGEGAFAAGLATLAEDGRERFYSNLTSDTALGDRIDITPTGNSGQPLDDVGSRMLELELPPGAQLRLQGRQELRGAASTKDGEYHGALALFVSLVAAVRLDAEQPPGGAASVTQIAEKAGGKASLVPAAIAVVLLLAAFGVWLKRRK